MPEEDRLLIDSIERHGTTNWALVALALPDRSGKQCRERWVNQLNPDLKLEAWTPEEDNTLISLARVHGHQWSAISQMLKGRSVNSTKNRYGFLMRHMTKLPGQSEGPSPAPSTFPECFMPTPLSRDTDPQPPSGKFKLPPISLFPIGPNRSCFEFPGFLK
jgi:hypothetical protein